MSGNGSARLEPAKESLFNVEFDAEPRSHIEPVGTVVLGIIALVLLFAFLRTQSQNRRLVERLARLKGP